MKLEEKEWAVVGSDAASQDNNRDSVQRPAGNRDSNSNGHSAEQAVTVRSGLEVYSQDDMLLGQVEEFIIDATGTLTSFVVSAGTSIGAEMRVMMDWIETVTRERIHLCITAAEARIAGSLTAGSLIQDAKTSA